MTDARPNEGEWNQMIKLSDKKGKYNGDPETILLAKKVLGIEGNGFREKV